MPPQYHIFPQIQGPTWHRKLNDYLLMFVQPPDSLKSKSSRTMLRLHSQVCHTCSDTNQISHTNITTTRFLMWHANMPMLHLLVCIFLNLSLLYRWFISCQGSSSDNNNSSPPPSTNDANCPPLPHNSQDHRQWCTTTWVPSSTHASLTDVMLHWQWTMTMRDHATRMDKNEVKSMKTDDNSHGNGQWCTTESGVWK